MKNVITPSKTHVVNVSHHVNMMRKDLLYRGFMIEKEKGAVCKQSNSFDDKREEQR